MMKPTRRELGQILRDALVAKLENELREVRKQTPKSYDPDPEVIEIATKRFLRRKVNADIKRALDRSKVPYRIDAYTRFDKQAGTVTVFVSFRIDRRDDNGVKLKVPKRIARKIEAAREASAEWDSAVQAKNAQVRRAACASSQDIVGQAINRFVLENGELVAGALAAAEKALKEQLEAAVADGHAG